MKNHSDDHAPHVARSRLASGNVYVALRSANRFHTLADRLAWVAVLLAAAIMLFVFVDVPF